MKTDEEVRQYLRGLKPGERVVETGKCCMTGREGTVYLNDRQLPCVKWDKLEGDTGHLSTAATWGTRRIPDAEAENNDNGVTET